MQQGKNADPIHLNQGKPHDNQSARFPILMPRIWKVLAALALPFIMFCANYCEALERASVLGAYFADVLLPTAIVGYIILVITLRNREV